MHTRREIIGVLGSGKEEHRAWVEPLARWVAHRGYHLLTGAGGPRAPGETMELPFCRHRKGGPFETGESDAILALIPHFRRAVVLSRRIEVAEAGRSAVTLTTRVLHR